MTGEASAVVAPGVILHSTQHEHDDPQDQRYCRCGHLFFAGEWWAPERQITPYLEWLEERYGPFE